MAGAERTTRRAVLVLAACCTLGACASTTNPTPSARYDGDYAGRRWSDKTVECGVTEQRGTTSAHISGGRLTLPLFGPRTRLEGSVGEDGALRASGLWANPKGGFPGMTILIGKVQEGVLQGIATDYRCHTEVDLKKTRQPRETPRSSGAGARQQPRS